MQNIQKAQQEIDRLEKESANADGKSEKQVNGSTSAGAEQEKDSAAEVTDDVKKASIEDKEAPATTA